METSVATPGAAFLDEKRTLRKMCDETEKNVKAEFSSFSIILQYVERAASSLLLLVALIDPIHSLRSIARYRVEIGNQPDER